MDNQIFISYSRTNSKLAQRLYDDLISSGYPVWIDKENEEAKEWKPQIDYHLRHSDRFIVMISKDSVKSRWVLHEGSMAYALKQKIIPLQLDTFEKFSDKQFPIWVEPIQFVDFTQINNSLKYQRLIRGLKQLLGDPIPIQKHLDEMTRNYPVTKILLEQVALDLIDKHADILIISPEAKELIEKSSRKLKQYWNEIDELEKSYTKEIQHRKELEKKVSKLEKTKLSLLSTLQEKATICWLFILVLFACIIYFAILSVWFI